MRSKVPDPLCIPETPRTMKVVVSVVLGFSSQKRRRTTVRKLLLRLEKGWPRTVLVCDVPTALGAGEAGLLAPV